MPGNQGKALAPRNEAAMAIFRVIKLRFYYPERPLMLREVRTSLKPKNEEVL
jgi:hypothetical protein